MISFFFLEEEEKESVVQSCGKINQSVEIAGTSRTAFDAL